MRNQVKFLFVVFSMAAFSSFWNADRGTSGQQKATSYDEAALAELFNEETAIFHPNAGGNPSCSGTSWLLAAKKDDDGDAEDDKEEKDDKGGGSTGFDRLWDVTCCG
jgi:hypothetical protein